MAKKAYVVLKLKDEFSKPLITAKEGTKKFEKQVKLTQKTLAKMTDNGMASLTKFSKKVAKVATGAAAAFAGIALAKGWERMVNIDNARTKLEAIGNSAEDVSKIMDNALASVKGTAYGMDAAATTAASAVAAGIEPGKKLESYLSSVADAAAVAGADMDDMGSIFNKVATKGSATNEVLTQLSERGIPIYQYLAKETGKTASEVFDLAKDGKISLEQFQNAVKNNIGGAAKEMGSKTITGAISNMKASISRIGSNFLGSSDDENSFAGKLLPAINKVTEYLGKLEEKAKEWGAVFGEKLGSAIDWVTKNFDKLKIAIKILLPMVAGFYSFITVYNTLMKLKKGLIELSNTMKIVKALGGGFKALLAANPIMVVAIAIGVLVTAFVTLYTNSEKFRKVCHKVWAVLKKVASYIAETVIEKFNKLKAAVSAVVKAVKKVISGFKKLFGSGDKNVNVNVNDNTGGYTGTSANSKKSRVAKKGAHKALGTTYFAGGATGFNELGSEEAILPSGTRIIPADKVGAGGGQNVTVNLTIQGNVIGNKAYMEETGNYIAGRLLSAMANS